MQSAMNGVDAARDRATPSVRHDDAQRRQLDMMTGKGYLRVVASKRVNVSSLPKPRSLNHGVL